MSEKEYKIQQMEALEELYQYNQKLIPAVESMIAELREGRREDTKELLSIIINGINWTIQVLNHTMDIINDNGESLDKERMNASIQELGSGLQAQDDLKIADNLEKGIIPLLQTIEAKISVKINAAN
ncbi:molecular chaperone [Anaerocolumna sp. AGMB13025]|uniref:molecular chaperone n=1 Tax=Anaerocolumna sp. AGMB13025 TaxID=3039116 RepID=UPI00241D8E14|nr:molecular chaperone [Anaerocolumna sp. AGMB13025]WFR56780.1 molecular chaperone [Anaerocolumna sp. AGMB13025]